MTKGCMTIARFEISLQISLGVHCVPSGEGRLVAAKL